ncbi:2-hydroxychromene-2-carboxylate isomerase [Sphingorhabdus lutea]|uniref:2-hydroxychromene-2-carboxylate isomerase n=1 Tax=Sphingorhabdus lutea TaxID=1913578 RepID=A0A1L3JAG7_9SPHN|nr:2-hydroxychromene-2-carboxylate isomerase [Sphingorhabdus lutea]APG62130.1 2-hydroxychromene-2-carboxylate isomerase [Sphingorhabdus lutea]
MSKRIEFFFDLSSPWTCLAFHNIRPIIQENDAQIIWRPILVGGIFNAVNKSVYAMREDLGGPKMRHYMKSLKDWSKWSGVEMNFPSAHHPLKSVLAMRVCCALEDNQPALEKFMEIAFADHFAHQVNLDDAEILAQSIAKAGFDAQDILQQTQSQEVKDRLRHNGEELISRGGYGSPSIFVDGDDMYFGNDQLPLIAAKLKA